MNSISAAPVTSQPVSRTAAQAALQASGLSTLATNVLTNALDDTTLLGCVGAPLDDVDSAVVTLVTVVLDDSGSMHGYQSDVIAAFNDAVTALNGAKGAESIQLSLWKFAEKPELVHSYTKISEVKPIDSTIYGADGNATALYSTTVAALTGLTVYGQQLAAGGVMVKRVFFLITDGFDNVPGKVKKANVRDAVKAALQQESYTFAFAGFGSDASDLEAMAVDLGFPKDSVTNGKTGTDLRRVFRQFSQSVAKVSQRTAPSAGGFFS